MRAKPLQTISVSPTIHVYTTPCTATRIQRSSSSNFVRTDTKREGHAQTPSKPDTQGQKHKAC
eukprot:1393227-Amphidinium_carterae.1